MNDIEKKALLTYQKNLDYFQRNHEDLYNKIRLFSKALDEGYIQQYYDLEYVENEYFDIKNIESGEYLYAENSIVHTNNLIKEFFTKESQSSSFKTFYDFKFDDEFINNTKNASILSTSVVTTAPIIHYVNKALPKSEKMKRIEKFIIFGVGLGIHIPVLIKLTNAKIFLIDEINLEIFRLSLFVTEYYSFNNIQLVYSVADDDNLFKKQFKEYYNNGILHNHYLKFFMFSNNFLNHVQMIQNFLVSQEHYCYSFERRLESLTRTVKYVKEKYNFIRLNKFLSKDVLSKPILVLAAGPSLQNNINFVKKNKNKFFIMAIYATMPLLEQHDIVPDIVTQYDQQNEGVMSTINKVQDINFFKDTLFIFASHIVDSLISQLPVSNIYFFQALYTLKKGFGTLTSISIGEMSYALCLVFGFKEIYLLGLDFALDPKTNASHIEGHIGAEAFDDSIEMNNESFEQYSFRKSLITIKGNFSKEVKSYPVFYSSVMMMNEFTNALKHNDTQVYNLSNGAFFEHIVPLKFNQIKFNNTFKKENYDLAQVLLEISENTLSDEDKKHLNEVLNDVEKIKQYFKDFKKSGRDSSADIYLKRLSYLIDKLCFIPLKCNDLQDNIKNYIYSTVPYFYYLCSLEGVSNQKKNLKTFHKLFSEKLESIIDYYFTVLRTLK